MVEEAQQDKIRWNYATWQMKVNLIYDMRNGLNDWVDDFTDEQRGDAVLTVLDSARNKEEFEKVVDGLKVLNEGINRVVVKIEDLIRNNQKSRYNEIKIRYQYAEL